MTYDSKFDWWSVSAIFVNVAALHLGGSYWIGVPILVVLFLCAYPQSYITAPDGLVVRAALTHVVIPYKVITAVSPADGAWSGAIGRGRIRVRYGLASQVLIAPSDGEAFLRDMAARTPHLMRRGQALVLALA